MIDSKNDNEGEGGQENEVFMKQHLIPHIPQPLLHKIIPIQPIKTAYKIDTTHHFLSILPNEDEDGCEEVEGEEGEGADGANQNANASANNTQVEY